MKKGTARRKLKFLKQIFIFSLVAVLLCMNSMSVLADSLTITPANGDEVYPGREIQITYTIDFDDGTLPYRAYDEIYPAYVYLYSENKENGDWNYEGQLSFKNININGTNARITYDTVTTAGDMPDTYSYKASMTGIGGDSVQIYYWYDLPEGVEVPGHNSNDSFSPTIGDTVGSFTVVHESLSLSIESIDFGGKLSPVVKYGGEVLDSDSGYTISYRKLGAASSSYTTDMPTEVGSYEAKVTWYGYEDTTSFQIREVKVEQKEGTGSITVPSFDYNNGKVTPTVSSSTNGTDHVKIEYKVSGAADSTYTTTVPTIPGKYTARATFDETDEYKAVQATTEFEIRKAVATATVTAESIYYGVDYTPKSTTTMQNPKAAVYEYKIRNGEDASYTTIKPTEVGDYTVRVTYPETEYYKAATATANYSITYMPAPKYFLAGTTGKNNFYTTNVTITTEEGYLVCSKPNGNFTTSILLSDTNNVSTLYFKNASTGAKSAGVAFTPIKIDTVKPQYTGAPGKGTTFSDFVEFTIADTNLLSITVNGENVDFTGEDYKLNLDADGGSMDYEIIVTDRAGNTSRLTFTLKAEWLETGIVPADMEISMEANTEYQFAESGTWMLEGDSTEYAAGMTFYMKEDGRYTFSSK